MVYFIRCGEFVKIGTTGSIEKRLKSLQALYPYGISLEGAVEGSHRLEKIIHAEYASKRHRGEWFALEKHDVARIIEKYSGWDLDNCVPYESMMDAVVFFASNPNEKGLLSANGLVGVVNDWRKKEKKRAFNLDLWLQGKKVQELLGFLGGDAISVALGETWVHPVVFIELSIKIIPSLKLDLMKNALWNDGKMPFA